MEIMYLNTDVIYKCSMWNNLKLVFKYRNPKNQL